ncbi:MAG: O-antigen ligase family protein [Sphingobacteriales bacterium]|nr:O-antigen ligase family protein [Sphingobacteriales bacterium]
MTASITRSNLFFLFFSALFIGFIVPAIFTENYFLVAIPFAVIFFYLGWLYRQTVFFLLLFTLPFSFEYQFSSTLGTDIPDEALMLFVSGLFLLYWIYNPEAILRKMLTHPLLILLLIYFVWLTITVVFSTSTLVSVKFLLAKTWYIGAFVLAPLILYRQRKTIVTAAVILSVSMLLVACTALIRHSANGFSFAAVNDSLSPFFRNHVNYSAMLVCTAPVLFAFYSGSKNNNQKILLGIFIFTLLMALFFSYGRGAWLALLIGGSTYWLIKKRLLVGFYIIAVLIAFFTLFWLKNNDRYLKYAPDFKTTIFHKNFGEHLIATYKLKDVSTEERFYRWIAGVRMIKDNWLTGYGPNTFYDNYKGYGIPAFKTWVSDNKDHSTVHNYFLLTAIEQGIPGLLILLTFFGIMLYYAQRIYHRCNDSFYKTVVITTGVISTMIITLIFLSDLIETDKIGSIFFLCIATLVSADIHTRKNSDSAPHIQSIP